MYCYEAIQSRRDGERREGGGGYRAVARFTREGHSGLGPRHFSRV